MRTAIQLGLGIWSEYLYLTMDDWTGFDCPLDWVDVPDFFKEDPQGFMYYGIDVDPQSIALLSNKNYANTRATWICAGVSDKFELTQEDLNSQAQPILHNRTTYLLVPFGEILKAINPPTFDVLAVDIEGFEYKMVDDMADWHILPTYITLEVFMKDGPNDYGYSGYEDLTNGEFFEARLGELGYNLSGVVPHLYRDTDEWDSRLHEFQFVRD